MKVERKKGISLIVLIITIIIIIILASAVILSLANNNPIEAASKATLLSDIQTFAEELNLYNMKKSIESGGAYEPNQLTANQTSIAYTGKGVIDTTGDIYTIFPSLKGKYDAKFEIKNGEIVFSGTTEKELVWARDAGIKVNIFTIENGVLKSTNASLSLIDNSGKLVIPDNVQVIDSGAFHDVDNLKELVIPGNVKRIADSAFSNNPTLEKVVMENGVEQIGRFAFENCTALKEVIVPDSVISMGDTTFSRCSSLEKLTLSNNLTSLPYRMVSSCSSLKNITIPSKVTTIDAAFEYCSALQTIDIPANVSSISSGAFTGCNSLTNINIDSNNQYFTFENGMFYNKAKTRLYFALTTITNFNFPATLTSISSNAFSGCNKIPDTINISKDITSIGDYAFGGCPIKNVNVDLANLNYSSENGILYDKNKKKLMFAVAGAGIFTVKDGVETIGVYAFQNSGAVTDIVLPTTLIKLESFSLSALSGLKKLNIPKNVMNISSGVLPSSLEEITVDSANPYFTVKSNMLYSKDGKKLVYGLKKYSDIVVPEGTEVLGAASFYSTSIQNITLPNSLKVIEGSAFDACSNIQKIEIPSSIESIDGSAFSRCNNLNQIIINKPVGSITGLPWSCPYGERAIIWK